MRDDEVGAALYGCVDGFLYEVLRLGVQCRLGLVQQQHLGGAWGWVVSPACGPSLTTVSFDEFFDTSVKG